MEMTFECPECGSIGCVGSIESTSIVTCRACSRTREVRSESFDQGVLRSCAWCATEDLYIKKDFPQGLGLLIVIAGFVASTVFWYYDKPVPALSILLVSALVDMVLFYIVPDVTICYRCQGQYRGAGTNPESRFKAFDLAIGERYRQERLRIEQLKGQEAPAESSPRPSN